MFVMNLDPVGVAKPLLEQPLASQKLEHGWFEENKVNEGYHLFCTA